MLEDYFEHVGPNGRHSRLIFQVMGESLSSFRQSFPHMSLPSPVVQKFTTYILKALSCAHSCGSHPYRYYIHFRYHWWHD